MASDNMTIGGTDNPYVTGSYTPASNDKNTLDMMDFFKLLATQLQYQDPTSPMDNSELMAQMTQMAMVNAMDTMTRSMDTSTGVTTQTYAAGLVGQEVTMAVTEENSYGQEVPVGVKYAKVEYVNFTTGSPTIKLEGDTREYEMTHLVGMGRVPDPYEDKTGDSSGEGDEDEGDGPTEPVEPTDPEGP